MLLRMFKNGQMQAYTIIKGRQERNWPETAYLCVAWEDI